MSYGQGIVIGHAVTLRRFLLTFWTDLRRGKILSRRGGGHQILDFWRKPLMGKEPVVDQGPTQQGIFTVEYPDERLPLRERFRVLPVLVYDDTVVHDSSEILRFLEARHPEVALFPARALSVRVLFWVAFNRGRMDNPSRWLAGSTAWWMLTMVRSPWVIF